MLNGGLPGLLDAICAARPPGVWGWGDLSATFAMWLVMMLAMMGPISLPWVLAFARHGAVLSPGRSRALRIAIFAGGYGLVWSAFGLLATGLQWGLHSAGIVTAELAWRHPWLMAAGLMVVGGYQFTPLKEACLTHCESPVTFFLTRWRDGGLGALSMGLRHGLHCVGCCWPLMCLMLVVGAMSLGWMAALTLFALVEMYGPFGRRLSHAAGAALIVAGLAFPILAG